MPNNCDMGSDGGSSELEEGEIPAFCSSKKKGFYHKDTSKPNLDSNAFSSISSSDEEFLNFDNEMKTPSKKHTPKSCDYVKNLMIKIGKTVSRLTPARSRRSSFTQRRSRIRKRKRNVSNSSTDDSRYKLPHKRKRRTSLRKDWDERRRELLKLAISKQKQCDSIPLPEKIEVVEMEDDSDMFVDCSDHEVIHLPVTGNQEKSFMDAFYVTRDLASTINPPAEVEEEDEELDNLRLMALNSKNKVIELPVDDNEDLRTEFELRAQALKSAVLKKVPALLNKCRQKRKENNEHKLATSASTHDNSVLDYLVPEEKGTLPNGVELVIELEKSSPDIPSAKVSLGVESVVKRRKRRKKLKKQAVTPVGLLEKPLNPVDTQLPTAVGKLEPGPQTNPKATLVVSEQVKTARQRKRLRQKRAKELLIEQGLRSKLLEGLTEQVQDKVVTEKKGLLPPPMPVIERIIVHLGDDSSDDEKTSVPAVSVTPVVKDNTLPGIKQKVNDLKAQYEKSVDQLLLMSRKNIENKAKKSTILIPTTPEAVYKHLPPSQRLEYMRLKKKLEEKEKFNAVNKMGNKPEEKDKPLLVGTGVIEPSNPPPDKGKVAVKVVPKQTKTSPKKLLELQKRAEQKLEVMKQKNRKMKIENLKVLLKKIRIEKALEEKAEMEVKRLKNLVILAERRINIHKMKIRKMADESKAIYQSIQMGDTNKKVTSPGVDHNEPVKNVEASEKKKSVQGQIQESEEGIKKEVNKVGSQEKVKVHQNKEQSECGLNKEESELSRNKEESELSQKKEGRELDPNKEESELCPNKEDSELGPKEKKVVPSSATSKPNEDPGADVNKNGSDVFQEYCSPLQFQCNVRQAGEPPLLDPNIIMCQFDLTGKCNDDECRFQHYRVS